MERQSKIFCDGFIDNILNYFIIPHHWRNSERYYVEIKCQLDATEVFIADLTACSTCFGHHYAHHVSGLQDAGLTSILQTGHITLSSTPDQQLENHSTKTTGSNHRIILLNS